MARTNTTWQMTTTGMLRDGAHCPSTMMRSIKMGNFAVENFLAEYLYNRII